MGLLDWLTESIGSSTGQGEAGMGMGPNMPPMPPGGAGAAPPAPPSSPPPSAAPPVSPPSPPTPPPTAITDTPKTQTVPTPASTPGAPLSLAPPPTPPTSPGTIPPPPGPSSSDAGITALGRAIGLDPNSKRQLVNSLAGGFKGVAANWNKPGLAAFAGGAGGALEGAGKTTDKIIEDQHKALTDAVAAVQIGDKRALMKAQTEKALADAQATMQGRGSKDSVVNSEQQLYLRAQGATNQDGRLKLLKSQYDNAARADGVDSDSAKAAKAAYETAYEETLRNHLQTLGIDPKKARALGKKPGMTQDNPIPHTQLKSQKDYDELPPGAWFVNPKDKRVLQKPLAPAAAPGTVPAGGAAPVPAGASPAPAPPPVPTTPPAQTAAAPANDDDDEET